MTFEPGTKVEIMEHGEWIGPFTVTTERGLRHDHLVLRGPSGMFEIHNDAPYNIRPVA